MRAGFAAPFEISEHREIRIRPHISRRVGQPLALPGIWSAGTDPATKELHRTFSLLTPEADASMTDLYHRRPVTIPEDDWAAWLDPLVEATHASQLAMQVPEAGAWQAWKVRTRVNRVANDDPRLILPMP